jgi:hypothetical protein
MGVTNQLDDSIKEVDIIIAGGKLSPIIAIENIPYSTVHPFV